MSGITSAQHMIVVGFLIRKDWSLKGSQTSTQRPCFRYLMLNDVQVVFHIQKQGFVEVPISTHIGPVIRRALEVVDA